MLKTLFNLGTSAFSGITSKVLLSICAILAGLCISAFIALKHYQKSYDEGLKQKAEIEAQFRQTHIILEKQNEAIKKASAELSKYATEIAQIKRATAKEFAQLKKRKIDSCGDFTKGVADLLKTYEKTSILKSAEITQAENK